MPDLSTDTVGIVGIVALLVLMGLRVPVGVSMMIVAVAGFAAITTPEASLARFGQDAFREASNFGLSVVPMFVLMGMFLANSGLGADVYQAMDRFARRLRGGLAVSTIAACSLFGAVNGSAVAGATTMSLVAVPEMERHGYDRGFAGALTAAGSTLGSLIPPSALLVLYGILTEFPIGDVLLAALLPGILVTVVLMVTAYLMVIRDPSIAPPVNAPPNITIGRALLLLWPVPVLFGISMGGLYGGLFTPSEAGAVGAFLALVYALATRRLTRAELSDAVSRSVRISAMVFLLVIAGKMFGYFLTVTRIPQDLARWVADLAVPAQLILVVVFVIYFVLGALMDESAILVIMTPLALPIVLALGYDGIWFGVLSIMMLLTGLITPPVGIITFVVSGVANIPIRIMYWRIMFFSAAVAVCVVAVICFPQIALYLPNRT
ncbi:TRAP transporter large permease [Nocardioides sp.]|uniref:TRAP transporter large permease n=1 Tax=Nocardioides sp. TaxID=35761 RepID=UPI0026292D3D|nr:TRAP transporter large permease [Nocardioides sp.]MCW2737965.1 transporter large permease [Nocardioides sp.]